MTAALVFSALVTLIMLYDIIFYSPVRYGWPLVQIMLWVTFLTSMSAAISTGMKFSAMR